MGEGWGEGGTVYRERRNPLTLTLTLFPSGERERTEFAATSSSLAQQCQYHAAEKLCRRDDRCARAFAAERSQRRLIGAHSFLSDRGLKPEDERALWDAFPDRLIDPPTSEGVSTSLVTGAAMAGMRPFLNYGTATFAYEAFNQIMSEAANVHAMSNGQLRAPLTLHMFAGIRGGGAGAALVEPAGDVRQCRRARAGAAGLARRRAGAAAQRRSRATIRPSSSPTRSCCARPARCRTATTRSRSARRASRAKAATSPSSRPR